MADRCGAARGDSSGAAATAMRDACDTGGPRTKQLRVFGLGTRPKKSKVQAGVLDSDAAARCGSRVASTLRALLALTGAAIGTTFAAQLALHLVARHAMLEHDRCADDDAPPGRLPLRRAIVPER